MVPRENKSNTLEGQTKSIMVFRKPFKMVFFLLFPLIGLHVILCPIGQFSKQHGF